jgi:hypothetical protein
MDDILKSAMSQVPGMVVLVIVVFYFLKYMGKRDELIKGLTDEHLSERKIQRDVIERNTVAAGVNTAALNNVAHILSEQSKKIIV